MTEPCKQEPMIRVMSDRQAAMDQKMDRMVKALESMAEHRVEIEHLAEQGQDSRKWLKDHERRIQTLEKAPGSTASRFLWIVVGSVVAIGPSVIAGILLYQWKG